MDDLQDTVKQGSMSFEKISDLRYRRRYYAIVRITVVNMAQHKCTTISNLQIYIPTMIERKMQPRNFQYVGCQVCCICS